MNKLGGIEGGSAANKPVSHAGFSDDKAPAGGYAAGGSDGNKYPASSNVLGVDLSTLADLPQDLRRRAIQALEALADARSEGNAQAESTAAATLAEIIGEIEQAHATKAVFDASLQKRKPSNADAVHWLDRRQGIVDGDLPPAA